MIGNLLNGIEISRPLANTIIGMVLFAIVIAVIVIWAMRGNRLK